MAEILIVAEALDERTRGSMREEHLRALDDGALVNVARGPIIEEAALLRVAAEGRLRIGLDVYHQEPLPLDHPLRALRHVCLLPHIGGPTADRRRDAGRHALRQLAGYLAGGRRGATGIANAGLHRPFLAPTSAGGMGAGRNLEEAG